jgi:hypothetical protein
VQRCRTSPQVPVPDAVALLINSIPCTSQSAVIFITIRLFLEKNQLAALKFTKFIPDQDTMLVCKIFIIIH